MCPHLVFSKIFHLFVQFRPNAHKNNVPWILHPFRGPPQNIKLTWYRMFHHVTAFYTHARTHTHTHTHTPWSHTHTHTLSLSPCLPPSLSLGQNPCICKMRPHVKWWGQREGSVWKTSIFEPILKPCSGSVYGQRMALCIDEQLVK